MSFLERINLVVLAALVVVYGWYFSTVGGELMAGFEPGAALASTNDKMFLAVGVFIALMIASSIVTAIIMGRESDEQDERDKMIDMRGDQRGGFALAVFALLGMGLAMADYPNVLVANAILAGLVASEGVKSISKLIDYRRGV
ncbi:hypothetical protein [Maricaulis sp.]|uniref:hypothetical protein n=1 Tax=Maricaulis sp. TaxID=1486257 RepID=UPI00260E3CBF|nr:hypothetical protein [Maricaulis sp.]